VPIATTGSVQQTAPEIGPQAKPEQSGFPCAMGYGLYGGVPQRGHGDVENVSRGRPQTQYAVVRGACAISE
jgi:hypothetical protein